MTDPTQTIGSMTLDELESLIDGKIIKHLHTSHPYHIGKTTPDAWQAILDSFIETPAGIPAPLEMLREERQQLYVLLTSSVNLVTDIVPPF